MVPLGFQNGAKIVNNDFFEAPYSKVAPNWAPNPLQWFPRSLQTPSEIDFGRGFGAIWEPLSSIVQPALDDLSMRSSAACCITSSHQANRQKASKKQLLIFVPNTSLKSAAQAIRLLITNVHRWRDSSDSCIFYR